MQLISFLIVYSILEISVRYPNFFGGLYYVNGNSTALPSGGRTLMLGDTRGVSSGFFAVGSTVASSAYMPGPVGADGTGHYSSVIRLYVKKDC